MDSKKASSLYTDNFIELYPDKVVVKAYFFPLASEREIPISAIQHVYYKQQTCLADFFSTKDWGMSLTPVWWACDLQRHIKHRYFNVVLDTGHWIRKGFTVVDVAAFLNALQPLLSAGVPIDEGNLPRDFKRLQRQLSKHVERLNVAESSRRSQKARPSEPGENGVGTSQKPGETPTEKKGGAFPPLPNYDDIMETVKAKQL